MRPECIGSGLLYSSVAPRSYRLSCGEVLRLEGQLDEQRDMMRTMHAERAVERANAARLEAEARARGGLQALGGSELSVFPPLFGETGERGCLLSRML